MTTTLTVGGVTRLKLFALFCALMADVEKKGLDGGKFRKSFLNPL